MTFNFSAHCLPQNIFDTTTHSAQILGQNAMLTLALVSHGRASFFAGEEAVLAGSGCFVLADGELHLLPIEECHVVGTSIIGSAADEFAAMLKGPFLLSNAACPRAAELLHHLIKSEHLPDALASELSYGMLCQLASANPNTESLPSLVAAAISLIRTNYAEVYGVEELAKELDVSKSHLVRSFSAALGTTPGKHLTAVRIEAAKRVLLQPEYSLETVAILCGFSGANYLCKVFKKQTGETPATWRAKNYAYAASPISEDIENSLYL